MTSPASPRPLIEVGDIVSIAEPDYLYGIGPLLLRVTAVDRNAGHLQALEWIRLRGVEIRWNGADGDDRDVLVRVSALRASQP